MSASAGKVAAAQSARPFDSRDDLKAHLASQHHKGQAMVSGDHRQSHSS